MSTHRVTILLTTEEKSELDRKRGLATMTAYIKHVLFGTASGVAETVDARPLPEGRVEKVSRQLPRERTSPVAGANPAPTTRIDDPCPHGYTLNNCKIWGCWRYEIANGRGKRPLAKVTEG